MGVGGHNVRLDNELITSLEFSPSWVRLPNILLDVYCCLLGVCILAATVKSEFPFKEK